MTKDIEKILNYQITTMTDGECIREIHSWLEEGVIGKYFICANPHSLEIAGTDAAFNTAIRNADLVVPDGIGVVIASKILGGSIRERITGMDIFLGLSEALNKKSGYRYFFLGSTENNLSVITSKMKTDFPNIAVTGTYSPPFKTDFSNKDNQAMINAINKAQSDVLWVGMTAPKQEKWIYANREKLQVKFIGAIGAVFDFYTGRVKRSHPVLQRMGLEWLPRLLRQPGRLWKRNFISNPRFMLRVIKSRFLDHA